MNMQDSTFYYNLYAFEPVTEFWLNSPEINVDYVSFKDAPQLLEILKHHKNLKKILFQKWRIALGGFTNISSIIAGNCLQLEVLDIPVVSLSEEDVKLLCNCSKLKYLNITYWFQDAEFVELLLANNPQLESVCIKGFMTNQCIDNIPNTVKEIEIRSYVLESPRHFLKQSQSWKLNKLTLHNKSLDSMHILMLCVQTTLVHLSISLARNCQYLEILFRNNPRLESIDLTTRSGVDGNIFLPYLTRNLKILKLKGDFRLNPILFEVCVKTWNLEILKLYGNVIYISIMKVLEASPFLYKVKTGFFIHPDGDLLNLEKLAQLRILRLYDLEPDSTALEKVIRSCVNLEKFRIDPQFLDDKILTAIAELPKLRYLCFKRHAEGPTINYDICMQYLSRSLTFVRVTLESCYGLTGAGVLTLIQGCKTLKKLLLQECFDIRFNAELFKDMVLAMEEQIHRTEILYIEVLNFTFYKEDMPMITNDLHPLLNIDIFE